MANRFIPYVPKPANARYSSKPLCKNVPKQPSTIDSSWQIERDSVPIRASTVDGDLLMEEVNGDDGIIVRESLTEICKSSDNTNGDIADSYFPTVLELLSSTVWKDELSERGLSKGYLPKAIDKTALDEGGNSIHPAKSGSGLDLGDSQDTPILVEDELDDTDSDADIDDSYQDSIKLSANYSHNRQTSLNTTISSSSIRKSESESGSDTDSNSEVDDRPAQKKQKTDNPQARTVGDDPLAVDDAILEGFDCQDPYSGQDPYHESMKLLATAGDDKPIDGGIKENDDVINAPQSHGNGTSHSLHTTPAPAVPAASTPRKLVAAIDDQSATVAAAAAAEWMKSALDDLGRTPQVAEVADDKQEWEICDIVGKEDVDGVPHYWVQWSVTLVPKSEMGKATALVARFEAGLRAQGKQNSGKGLSRLLPSKTGKQAAAGVRPADKPQEKRGRGRPRKQV